MSRYVIILMLTNGERKTIPATRFSVPTTQDIADAEKATRSEANPRGAMVYGWYRARRNS